MESIKCACGNRLKPHSYLGEKEVNWCFSCRMTMGVLSALMFSLRFDTHRSYKSRDYWTKKLETLLDDALPFSDEKDAINS